MRPSAADRWVVAIGGNALAGPHDARDLARQEERIAPIAAALADVLARATSVVIVHGNGPQVGARLLQNEAAQDQVPPSSLAVCVAETQAQIGHLLSLGLQNEARRRGLAVPVACLVTHVLGGGVPLVEGAEGLRAVDGVVDKDYTAACLATAVGASRLVVLTDVPGVALSFGTRDERYLPELTARDAREYQLRGEFEPGSMAPKVEACLEFLAAGGEEAVIAATTDAAAAFAGHAGTRVLAA